MTLQHHKLETPSHKVSLPNYFFRLGRIKVAHKLELRDDAVSFALMTPRRVVIPMLNKVKEKLEDVVKIKVIQPVE